MTCEDEIYDEIWEAADLEFEEPDPAEQLARELEYFAKLIRGEIDLATFLSVMPIRWVNIFDEGSAELLARCELPEGITLQKKDTLEFTWTLEIL